MIEYTNKIMPEEINILRTSVDWKPINIEALKKGIENTTCMVCAKEGEHIVGMARLLFDFCSIGYITDVIVHPAYQGRGIGKEMMTRLIEFAQENAPSDTEVWLNLCSSKGKEEFYRKLGFIVRPSGNFGAGMSKRLRCTKSAK